LNARPRTPSTGESLVRRFEAVTTSPLDSCQGDAADDIGWHGSEWDDDDAVLHYEPDPRPVVLMHSDDASVSSDQDVAQPCSKRDEDQGDQGMLYHAAVDSQNAPESIDELLARGMPAYDLWDLAALQVGEAFSSNHHFAKLTTRRN
jgi:hypothetical protein